MKACGVAIAYRGSNTTIRHNLMINALDDTGALEVNSGTPRSTNVTMVKNTIKDISDDGLDFDGDNSLIQHNWVVRTGNDSSESGIKINGSDNQILDNTAKLNANSGIKNDNGDSNLYRGNLVTTTARLGLTSRPATATW